MLRALKETGINARLTQSTYEAYKDETSAIAKNWESSLEKELPSDLRVGITKQIPTPVNQKLYSNIIFDHRTCDFEERVDRSDADKEAYKTIAIGGSIPCAMATVRKYFNGTQSCASNAQLDEDLVIEIGKVLVENGYRTPDNGTLWIALDKVLEMEYGIVTKIQNSIFELADSLCSQKPVIALVPASFLHGEGVPTNECIIIWNIADGMCTFSTTSSNTNLQMNANTLLKNIKRAWACSVK